MKEIELTQGMVALVDDCFFEALNQYSWRVSKRWNTFYALRTTAKVDGKRTTIEMQRDVVRLAGLVAGRQTDHRDGNGLNNQLDNIRVATASQNRANSRLGVNNTSGFKGVSALNGQWQARIRANGELKQLGQFRTKEEAAAAYDAAALEAFGEFAKTNAQLRSECNG